ncbi:thioredoxin family protein [soil metagenome]
MGNLASDRSLAAGRVRATPLRTRDVRGPLAGLVLFWALLGGPASATPEPKPLDHPAIGAPAPPLLARDIGGRSLSLEGLRGRVVVLEWTNPVCPFTAKKYAKGAMQAVQRNARAAGVVWITVDTSPAGAPGHLTAAQAKARLKAVGAMADGFILDESGDLGRRYGAKTTPTVFIIDRSGRLAYQGAVDGDPYGEEGPKVMAFARAALDDLARGRPIRNAETRPYGCPVEY